MVLPASSLNAGIATNASPIASNIDTMVKINASPRNCQTNWSRAAPRVLRTPTSRARIMARAVARFIKLMQAMSRINAATNPKKYRFVRFPQVPRPSRFDVR